MIKHCYSPPVEPSLLVSVFSLEEKGKGRENSVPWSGGQPAIMQRRSRPHLRINGHRARQLRGSSPFIIRYKRCAGVKLLCSWQLKHRGHVVHVLMQFLPTIPPFNIRASALNPLRHLIHDDDANTGSHHIYISKAVTDILNLRLFKDPVWSRLKLTMTHCLIIYLFFFTFALDCTCEARFYHSFSPSCFMTAFWWCALLWNWH